MPRGARTLVEEHAALTEKAFSGAGLTPEEDVRLAVVRAGIVVEDRDALFRAFLRTLQKPTCPMTITQAAIVKNTWRRLTVEFRDAIPCPLVHAVYGGSILSLTWTRQDGAQLELDVDADGIVEWSYLSPRNRIYDEGGKHARTVPQEFYQRARFFCTMRAVDG